MRKAIRSASGLLAQRRGNILVYVVVTMVIFAVLGASMVSLFSTSVTSSAVRNDARRAAYLSESGLRYAMSELRSRLFSKDSVDDLNDVTYEVDQAGSFTLEALAHQFRSLTDQVKSPGETLSLRKDKGEIFSNFLAEVPTESPYLSIVNLDSMTAFGSATYNTAEVSAAAFVDSSSFDLTVADDFSVSRNNYVAFAVAPHQAKTLTPNGDGSATIEIKPAARSVFPKRDGAFYIGTDPGRVFFYQSYEDLTDRLELKNITADPLSKEAKSKGATAPVEVKTDDLIILSENNYVLASRGRAGEAAFGGGMDHATGIANPSLLDELKDVDRYDIGDETLTYQADTTPGGDFRLTSKTGELFALDDTEKSISIGGGSGDSFGALWFSDTRSIGGKQNFCVAGACEFGRGIRAFFTFAVTAGSEGDGFIFSIVNGENNSINSVGGDTQQSELLGYAGDSRTAAPPADPAFLDGSGQGLQAPKIGLEFDTRVNYSAEFEKTQKFCSGDDLKPDTRNDPLSSDKHAVQYVFWGKDIPIDVGCRPTASRKTYDDNRHDAVGFGSGNWAKNLFGNPGFAPAVGADGNIYIGSAATTLFAVNPDGSAKWEFTNPTGNVYSPVIQGSRIYVNSADNRVYAVNLPGGSLAWSVPTVGPITERPVADSDGFVYVTSGNSIVKIQDGTTVRSLFLSGITFTSPPVLSKSGNRLYIAFNNSLDARGTADLERAPGWPSSEIGAVVGAPTVDPDTGYIFVSAGNSLFKINPAAPTSTPGKFTPGGSPTSSPSLSRDGTRVYVGFDNGKLYALDAADLSPIPGLEFPFPAAGSAGTRITTALVDDSENIYVGSDNGYVYALFADGSVKWEFNSGGAVNASPAIDKNGVVYAGSNYSGGQLWAINQFTEPRNYRQNFEGVAADSELAKNLIAYSAPNAVNPYFSTTPVFTNKWFKDGPWAVRFEIDRTALPESKGGYTLRAWVQQCTDINCTNVRGTFFADTRVRYAPASKPPNLVQSFELDGTLNSKFNTFLFGFNTARRSTDDQVITIDNFQLSFIRPGDPQTDVE
jgi:hypothetical protein